MEFGAALAHVIGRRPGTDLDIIAQAADAFRIIVTRQPVTTAIRRATWWQQATSAAERHGGLPAVAFERDGEWRVLVALDVVGVAAHPHPEHCAELGLPAFAALIQHRAERPGEEVEL